MNYVLSCNLSNLLGIEIKSKLLRLTLLQIVYHMQIFIHVFSSSNIVKGMDMYKAHINFS